MGHLRRERQGERKGRPGRGLYPAPLEKVYTDEPPQNERREDDPPPAGACSRFGYNHGTLPDRRKTSGGILSPLVLHLFLVDDEARLQVVRQGSGVVLVAGVQPEAPGLVAPRPVDGPLEEIPPQALADELRQQPELHQFDLAL